MPGGDGAEWAFLFEFDAAIWSAAVTRLTECLAQICYVHVYRDKCFRPVSTCSFGRCGDMVSRVYGTGEKLT
jgi:hypothetical protein